MAEEKKTPKAKETKPTKKDNQVKAIDYSKLTVDELKFELTKKYIEVKLGQETNTTVLKKIRKEIARKLTIKK